MQSRCLQGQMLGKYQVLEPLGRGGMARVYRAYHPGLDRHVAIKVMRSDLLDDTGADAEGWQGRFRTEARAIARLRHPSIVQVFDFDAEGEIYYMVMELLDGDTLKACLNGYRVRGERIPAAQTVRVLLDVLGALSYAHAEGVVHRDIKPANIMLTRQGQAVVTDFGIAQIIGGTRHTVSGALMGTLNYMAPEQGLEGRCDARGDLYSLGIVLYEMLTLRTPFDADTPLAILMKHLNDPLPLPRQVDPTVPEALEAVVVKALAKRPEERYQTAEEMAQALLQEAKRAGVEVPMQASLLAPPMAATAPEDTPKEVAILSGAARARIQDAQFADGATDPHLGQRLALTTMLSRAWLEDRVAQLAHRFVALPIGVGQAILGAVGVVVVGNLLAVMVSGVTGWWEIFARGWPIELLLVSFGLCVTMNVCGSIWLLIPIAILLGNGLLFGYCALTGNWRHWACLWPIELLLLVTAVMGTAWLARQDKLSRHVGRIFSWLIGLAALSWSAIVGFLVLVAAALS